MTRNLWISKRIFLGGKLYAMAHPATALGEDFTQNSGERQQATVTE